MLHSTVAAPFSTSYYTGTWVHLGDNCIYQFQDFTVIASIQYAHTYMLHNFTITQLCRYSGLGVFSPECNVCSKQSRDCSSGTVHPYKLQCLWDCVFALHNSRREETLKPQTSILPSCMTVYIVYLHA